jgi:hypothetical protein
MRPSPRSSDPRRTFSRRPQSASIERKTTCLKTTLPVFALSCPVVVTRVTSSSTYSTIVFRCCPTLQGSHSSLWGFLAPIHIPSLDLLSRSAVYAAQHSPLPLEGVRLARFHHLDVPKPQPRPGESGQSGRSAFAGSAGCIQIQERPARWRLKSLIKQ